MKISKRLRAIGDLVSDNSFILDVGCDHAFLDIYVVLNKKGVCAIASDINEGPLNGALENVLSYGVSDKVKVVLGDGLSSYEKGVDTIVLSGLGSTTIVDILRARLDVLDSVSKLIISSNNDYYFLRKSICDLGFKISNEIIIEERGKFYPIIVFEKGKGKYNKFELSYGPVLLANKSDTFIKYLDFNKRKLLNIYNSLGVKYLFRKISIKREIKFIDRV